PTNWIDAKSRRAREAPMTHGVHLFRPPSRRAALMHCVAEKPKRINHNGARQGERRGLGRTLRRLPEGARTPPAKPRPRSRPKSLVFEKFCDLVLESRSVFATFLRSCRRTRNSP